LIRPLERVDCEPDCLVRGPHNSQGSKAPLPHERPAELPLSVLPLGPGRGLHQATVAADAAVGCCLASDAWPSWPICPIWAAGWFLGFFFTVKCRTAVVQPEANLLASLRAAWELASQANGASARRVTAAMTARTRGLWAKCLVPLKNSFRIKAVVAFPWTCTLETSTAGKSSS
jgi:hypothetical protein